MEPLQSQKSLDVEQTLRSAYPKYFDRFPDTFTRLFMAAMRRLFYENEINLFLQKNSELVGIDFVEKVMEYFNFSYSVSKKDIENIPASGKVVIISNHPLGGLDSLALLSLIYSVRKDVKILANELLMNLRPMAPLMLPIDNMTGQSAKESIKGVYRALKNEEAVVIFPAGEVSRVRPTGIRDTEWHDGFLRFAKKVNAPILPMFVHARNSTLFYTVSMLYKPIAAVFLVHEMFNKRNKTIRITVGELIPFENVNNPKITSKSQLHLLKRHLYRIAKNRRGVFVTQKCISHPENRQDLKKELLDAEKLGKTADNKLIYLAEYHKDSSLMREIGRLREFTFRKVGEGTGKKRDIDSYDVAYKHIILWDDDALELVGAYRLGESQVIMGMENGREGFYTASLFDFQDAFNPYLENTIELGRSFVQPRYWGSRALDYLWFGIGSYLRAHPEVRYLFGPVTLSATYPKMARDLLIYFYQKHFGSEEGLVVSKNRYVMTRQEQEECAEIFTAGDYSGDFRILKKQLMQFDLSVPTLYKQYGELCEGDGVKFLDFGVDPDFENCIDGFILVDVEKIKESKKKRYMTEWGV